MRADLFPYADRIQALARRFRPQMSPSQALLWAELRGRRLLGHRFERNAALDRYTVGFYCRELNFAIDVLGVGAPWHGPCYEVERTIRLRLCGVTYLPLTEDEVAHNLDGVVARIRHCIRYLPVK